jgi:hypothetical protein
MPFMPCMCLVIYKLCMLFIECDASEIKTIIMYSQTCLEQSLTGNVKSDLLKEVQSKRTNFFMDVNEHKLC